MENEISFQENIHDEALQEEDSTEKSLEDKFKDLFKEVTFLKKRITNIHNSLKDIQKHAKKENKHLKKEILKLSEPKTRKPSGFAKPSKISKELCKFMELPENSEIARTEVTKYIIQYIKEHKLEKEDERKVILPDKKLEKLLKSKKKDSVTYFNIQKFMNKHFIK